MKYLEVACFNLKSAKIAIEAGVDRIEFCSEMSEGGLTPSEKDFTVLRNTTPLPIHVMIRLRGGNFCYNANEISQMRYTMDRFKDLGADGFVFGTLTKEKTIDKLACVKLVAQAEGFPCTFHRAIDRTTDIIQAMEDIMQCGISEVLTSGGNTTAMAGIENLKILQSKFGKDINIMPGGGVRSSNLEELMSTNCHFFHSSGIIDQGETADKEELLRMKKVLLQI